MSQQVISFFNCAAFRCHFHQGHSNQIYQFHAKSNFQLLLISVKTELYQNFSLVAQVVPIIRPFQLSFSPMLGSKRSF